MAIAHSKQEQKQKLMFVVTEDWYFCTHRLGLAIAAREQGFDVSVVTRDGSLIPQITAAGIRHIPITFSRSGLNPLADLLVIYRLYRIFRRHRPDIVHNVAIKPVLYGTLASRLAGVQRIVNAIAGMGYVFTGKSFKARLLKPLIELLFSVLLNTDRSTLILQNSEDFAFFSEGLKLSEPQLKLILGAGVDADKFGPTTLPPEPLVIVLPARMLWSKGVGEFVEAAKRAKSEQRPWRFVLVGGTDSQNPDAIDESQLQQWQSEGWIEYWGNQADMVPVYRQSHLVCLPSYREGLPKSLLEAAACARAIVTTDVPGCRSVVEDGINGILVPPKDAQAVFDAISHLADSDSLMRTLGEAGRKRVEALFSAELINRQTLALYQSQPQKSDGL